jgi:hypothetical protein
MRLGEADADDLLARREPGQPFGADFAGEAKRPRMSPAKQALRMP